jgi:hypothetical protein
VLTFRLVFARKATFVSGKPRVRSLGVKDIGGMVRDGSIQT